MLPNDHALFRSIFGHASVGMVTADPEQRLMHCNLAFCAMLGYGHEEIIGLRLADVVAPEDIARIEPGLVRSTGEQASQSKWRFTARPSLAQFSAANCRTALCKRSSLTQRKPTSPSRSGPLRKVKTATFPSWRSSFDPITRVGSVACIPMIAPVPKRRPLTPSRRGCLNTGPNTASCFPQGKCAGSMGWEGWAMVRTARLCAWRASTSTSPNASGLRRRCARAKNGFVWH